MWLFRNKKDGDPEKQEASSALWRHSRDAHNGALEVKDWKSSITSTHIGALGRQVTEAMSIASGQPGVVLLNSKHEFGANLVNEVVIMRGGQVLGVRKDKRKKEEEGVAEGGHAVPPPKRRRPSSQGIVGGEAYKDWTSAQLERECRRRRLPVEGGTVKMKTRLTKEDKTQPNLLFVQKEVEGARHNASVQGEEQEEA